MGVRTGTGWYLQQCPVGGASEVCRAGTPDLFLGVLSGGSEHRAGGIFQCDRTGTCIFPDRGIAWNHCDQPDGIHAVEAFGVTGVWMAFPVTEVVTFGIAMGIQGVSKRKE